MTERGSDGQAIAISFASRALILTIPEGSPGSLNMRDQCLRQDTPCVVRAFAIKGNRCVPA